MSENRMWLYLREKLQRDVELTRIEDKLQAGVSDVVYSINRDITGWLELKFLERVDKGGVRANGRRCIPWKSPAQPQFLNRQARRGVRAGVLLRQGHDDSWCYWRAQPDVKWVAWAQTDMVYDELTPFTGWRGEWCGPGLNVPWLLAQLSK